VSVFLRDLLDCPLSLGSVHSIVRQAVSIAHEVNAAQDLSRVRAGSHDELFQAGQPVLAGMDLDSTYCYLLVPEAHRDAETWGIHLMDLAARGLRPDYTIADGGRGLRAGQALAWPGARCAGAADGPGQASPPGPCLVPATRPRPCPRGERPAPGR
jgi:hypothetical protein